MKNAQKLDAIMLELGHDDRVIGGGLIREAALIYERGMSLTKDLYPGLAKAHGTTPSAVERNMRHAMEKAWSRADYPAQQRLFGSSTNPASGRPTVGEYVARLARVIDED